MSSAPPHRLRGHKWDQSRLLKQQPQHPWAPRPSESSTTLAPRAPDRVTGRSSCPRRTRRRACLGPKGPTGTTGTAAGYSASWSLEPPSRVSCVPIRPGSPILLIRHKPHPRSKGKWRLQKVHKAPHQTSGGQEKFQPARIDTYGGWSQCRPSRSAGSSEKAMQEVPGKTWVRTRWAGLPAPHMGGLGLRGNGPHPQGQPAPQHLQSQT